MDILVSCSSARVKKTSEKGTEQVPRTAVDREARSAANEIARKVLTCQMRACFIRCYAMPRLRGEVGKRTVIASSKVHNYDWVGPAEVKIQDEDELERRHRHSHCT